MNKSKFKLSRGFEINGFLLSIYVLRFKFLLILAIFSYSSNCGFVPEKEKLSDDPLFLLGLLHLANSMNCSNQDGKFWVRNVVTNQSDCIQFVLEERGENSEFYREMGLTTRLNFREITTDFDAKIHPPIAHTFGAPSDINGDRSITVLVLDIRDGAQPRGPFIAGFFDPVDLLDDRPGSLIRSNRKEIIYMDGKELVGLLRNDPLAFGSTLAHEYQHLIRFPRMREAGGQDDIWIDEGSSEVASDIGGFGPQTHRLNCLMGASNSPCTQGGNNVSLMDWGRAPENDSFYLLKQYSYAYAFMRYLFDNSGTNVTSRRDFFYTTANGGNGLRANNLTNLLSIFRNSTSNNNGNPFPLNPLGSTPNETFFLLLHSFWGQIIQGMGISEIRRFDSGTPVILDLMNPLNIRNEFPLGGRGGSDGVLNFIKDRSDFPSRTNLPASIPSGAINRTNNLLNPSSITSPIPISTSNESSGSQIVAFFDPNRSSRLTITSPNILSSQRNWNRMRFNIPNEVKSPQPIGIKNFPFDGQSNGIPLCGNPFMELD